jgi:hypothetical protein
MKLKKAEEETRTMYMTAFEAAGDRIDRFRFCLVYPELRHNLSDRDSEYFEKLEMAFRLTFKSKIISESISIIENTVDGAERRAYAQQIFRDMKRLYDFMDLNLELENKLYYMRQRGLAMAAHQLAAGAQDFDYVSKIEERAAKAIDVHTPISEDEDEDSLPKLLIITSGDKVFEKQKRGEQAQLADVIDDEEGEYGE